MPLHIMPDFMHSRSANPVGNPTNTYISYVVALQGLKKELKSDKRKLYGVNFDEKLSF